MKRVLLFVALCVGGLLGCNSAPPLAKTAEQSIAESRMNALNQKLERLSPADRAKYLQDHPDELKQLAGS